MLRGHGRLKRNMWCAEEASTLDFPAITLRDPVERSEALDIVSSTVSQRCLGSGNGRHKA